MSFGLFIGSLVVLAIGMVMGAIGSYIGHTSNEKYIDLNCGKNIFSNYMHGGECDMQTAIQGAGIGVLVVGGIFIIVGFIASIIFGVKLLMERRKKNIK